MAQTPEGKIKQQVKDFLNSLAPFCWIYMPVPMGYGRRGIKDFLGAYKGQAFQIETKALRKGLTPWQERETTDARAAGVWVFDFQPGLIFEDFEKAFCQHFKVSHGAAI